MGILDLYINPPDWKKIITQEKSKYKKALRKSESLDFKRVPKFTPSSAYDRLTKFWSGFGGTKNNGVGFPQEEKLAALKKYTLQWIGKRIGESLLAEREAFNKRKYKLHALSKWPKCFCCGEKAVLRHHIIPLRNGGSNKKLNIVSLCEFCHTEVHPWMSMKWLEQEIKVQDQHLRSI